MDEQTQVDSPDVHSRLEAFFSTDEPEAAPQEEQAAAPEAEESEAPEQEEAAPEEAPEGETFEDDGETYVLPPKLAEKVKQWKEGDLRREDYTRKTQELAEITRQVTTMAETVQMAQRLEQEIAPEKSELERVKYQLSQFKTVNWNELDVSQHLALKQQMDALKERSAELDTAIKEKQGKFSEWKEAKKREVLQSGQKYLQQTIKGWGQEAAKEVTAAVKEVGYSDDEVENVLDARFVRLAWKAAQFDKLQASKPQAIEAARKAPPVVKPGVAQKTDTAHAKRFKENRQELKKTGSLDAFERILRGM